MNVIYNADCPVCAYEIDAYARYAKDQALPIRFDDLNCIDLDALGLTEDAAARRLHVLKDGDLLVGVDGFIALWSDMPRYRPLARIVGLPVLRQIAGFAYERVLAPLIYHRHRRRHRLRRRRKLRAQG